MYYVGILEGAGEGWGVRVPDCPGCHGRGATADAAISDAISALRECAAQMASLYRQRAGRTVQTSRLIQDCWKPSTRRPWPASATGFWRHESRKSGRSP